MPKPNKNAKNLPQKEQYTKDQIEELMEPFKTQKLPLARIKKIMKSDEEVRVSSQAKLDEPISNSYFLISSTLNLNPTFLFSSKIKSSALSTHNYFS